MSLVYVFIFLAIASGALILFTKNILYCAYLLAICLLSVGAMYVFAGNTFLAVSQILVYVGGVVVIIVFGVMVTSKGVNGALESRLRSPFVGTVLGIGAFGLLTSIFLKTIEAKSPAEDVSIPAIGVELMTNYLLAFEAIAMLLLIAIIGASAVARSEIKNGVN